MGKCHKKVKINNKSHYVPGACGASAGKATCGAAVAIKLKNAAGLCTSTRANTPNAGAITIPGSFPLNISASNA